MELKSTVLSADNGGMKTLRLVLKQGPLAIITEYEMKKLKKSLLVQELGEVKLKLRLAANALRCVLNHNLLENQCQSCQAYTEEAYKILTGESFKDWLSGPGEI